METQSHSAWLLQKMDSAAAANCSVAGSPAGLGGGGAGAQPLPPLAPAAMHRMGGGAYGQQLCSALQQQQQDSLAGNELSVIRSWDVVARVRALHRPTSYGRTSRSGAAGITSVGTDPSGVFLRCNCRCLT